MRGRGAVRAQAAAPAPVRAAIVPAARRLAAELGVMGWIRDGDDGAVRVHVEGDADAVGRFVGELRKRADWSATRARVEGHEQFAQRGVSAGVFVVQEHAATAHHFDLRLEVGGVMRSWALPKGPSLDPGVKRLAVEVEDHAMSHNSFEGRLDRGGVIVWDRGGYEQGGRVPWPQALQRGHAVFVLHGDKLHGGFVLQRTHSGARAQWLLVKRRDAEARPGSDVTTERPESVVSGQTLAELLG